MPRITILGAGSWGTALAVSLAAKGLPVTIWCRNKAQAEAMVQTRENKKYLPGVILVPNIHIVTDVQTILPETTMVIMAIPTQNQRAVLEELGGLINKEAIVVNVSKGLEAQTHLRLSQVFAEFMPDIASRYVAFYGPSHAEEVGVLLPTVIVASSTNMAAAEFVQETFMAPHLRVYTNEDLLGVELGGALKNIVALANGIAKGLGYGDNAQAALITRGLAEMTRLGTTLGANPLTFSGLTGVGDLIVTCTSEHSRNRRAGYALGQGKPMATVLAAMGMVVEGVKTTEAAYALAQAHRVSMPIVEEMYKVLFENYDVRDAVGNLMGRSKKSEQEDYLSIK